jgi:hypothetical protein
MDSSIWPLWWIGSADELYPGGCRSPWRLISASRLWRTKEALDQVIAELLPLLTADDAKAWFRLPFNALQQ